MWFYVLIKKISCKPCTECSKITRALKKILATELIFVPMVTLTGLTVMSTMSGKCWSGIVQDVDEKFADIVWFNWIYWPPMHVFKYIFFIPRHQGFFFKMAYLPWAIYLSWKYHLDECKGCCCQECKD
ncbi:unnamed protein product [Brassicogethes aeneus]|uniref:Mitochondrial inner membrane protein Mpv17 n=1 Tax=Brassicogethes aeneus TaxID=1431903 RepID=A0A9P0BBD9_BRAAE|nr:unnamed protein product [Brassicogethes aeneus]